MSDAPETPEAAAPVAAAAKPGNPLVLVGAVAGALAVGAALGALIVGPGIVASRAAAATKAATVTATKSSTEHSPVVKIDNVIVNPAGSQGLHFLMVSIAVEVPGPKQQELLHARDAELRDIAVSILQKQTLESLDRPGARDEVKRQVLAAVGTMLGSTQGVRIFVPQFVIQ